MDIWLILTWIAAAISLYFGVIIVGVFLRVAVTGAQLTDNKHNLKLWTVSTLYLVYYLFVR